MKDRHLGMIRLAVLALSMTGCAPRAVHLSATAPAAGGPRDFIDLQPGWRLRVVTPLLKSGGYTLTTQNDRPVALSDGKLEITATAGDEFLGYELAYFSVELRVNGRLRLSLASSKTIQSGHELPQSTSVAPLPRLPGSTRHIRLIYVIRVSQADHNLAMLAASNKHDLDLLTERVTENPSECQPHRGASCFWIPAGIAITPEHRKDMSEPPTWVAAP